MFKALPYQGHVTTATATNVQCIRVRFYGATNTKGAYLKAFPSGKRDSLKLTYTESTFADCKNADERAERMAVYMAVKLGWYGDMVGALLSNDEWVFVFKSLGGRDL